MNPECLANSQRPANWSREATLHHLAEIGAIVEAVAEAMAEADYPREDIFGMRLALDEAICNAVKHGNRGDRTKKVHVRYHVTAERILAEVEDEGMGFDPHQVPDPLTSENQERPCGRGLLLMRQYATWVRYNERGNCVALLRRRSVS